MVVVESLGTDLLREVVGRSIANEMDDHVLVDVVVRMTSDGTRI